MDNNGLRPINERLVDTLRVEVFSSRRAMGEAAAKAVGTRMKELLRQKERISMVFAAAPSQNEFLQALVALEGIEWTRIVAYHLDEYLGLSQDAPQRFSKYLDEHIFGLVPFAEIHYLDASAADSAAECARYGRLLEADTIDIACIGIGENGHIAFNDPPVADFNDPLKVKAVELDQTCREQQVHDGCFETIDQVPTHALTLTVPAILSAAEVHCMVPATTKKEAVKACLYGPISTECPASVLRTHPRARLYLDPDSAALIL